MALAAAIVAGLLTLGVLFKPFFGNWQRFLECVGFWIQPNLWSALRGELHEDWLASLKLFLWLALGGLVALAAYVNLERTFG